MTEVMAGEVKIWMSWDDTKRGMVRLRAAEEDGCLWRLRCGDMATGSTIRRVLKE